MNKRIISIDLIRGVILLLMAIDHVRVYSGLPAGGPDPGIFFTRWITHFCVPGFVFFAGTGAYLMGKKTGDRAALSRFLVLRGLLLVVLELTLIRFFWTFNWDYGHFTLAGVIWMLGWCMILLAGLVRWPARTVGIIGLGIAFGQQLFGWLGGMLPVSVRPLWDFIYPTGTEPWQGLSILYTIVPWIGVMAAGYGFGTIMTLEPAVRRRICLRIGLSATVLFLLIGGGIVLWGPAPEHPLPPLLRLLNQQKYPASQLYLLMTLGPMIALLPAAEKARGWLANIVLNFGRVPLFYYLLHIPLIHLSALVVNYLRDGVTHSEWYATAPYDWVPEGQRWTLGLLYVVWLADIVLLYFVCRRYARYKAAHPEKKWLKYV
jgi:uncharacterized membrane protein